MKTPTCKLTLRIQYKTYSEICTEYYGNREGCKRKEILRDIFQRECLKGQRKERKHTSSTFETSSSEYGRLVKMSQRTNLRSESGKNGPRNVGCFYRWEDPRLCNRTTAQPAFSRFLVHMKGCEIINLCFWKLFRCWQKINEKLTMSYFI